MTDQEQAQSEPLKEAHLSDAQPGEVQQEAQPSQAPLSETPLSRAQPGDAHLSETHLGEAQRVQAQSTPAQLREEQPGEAQLSQAHLGQAGRSRAELSKAHPGGAQEAHAQSSEAQPEDTQLGQSNLSRVQLSKVQLSELQLSELHLSQAHLSQAHLSQAHLSQAHLSQAHLSQAHLSQAHLSQAHLSQAHLSQAHLNQAHLSQAHLSQAHLSQAHLSDAQLGKAQEQAPSQSQTCPIPERLPKASPSASITHAVSLPHPPASATVLPHPHSQPPTPAPLTRRTLLRASSLSAVAALAAPAILAAQPPSVAPDTTPLPAPILALTSRRSEATPIPLSEREQRIARAQQLMHQHGLSAIVLAGGTSLTYFTGIRWGNSERLFACVLPQSGSPFFVAPVFEQERVRERLAQVPGGKDAKVYTWQEDASPYAQLGAALRDHGLAAGAVGLAPGATSATNTSAVGLASGASALGIEERVPFVFADEIAKACPALRIVSATPVTAGCRSIKSPAELALMRLASAVTLQVYEAVWRSAHPGITTAAFTALIAAAYARVGFPGEASCQTGIYSALPHGSLEPQVIHQDAIVLIDDGCVVEGYQSDLSRTFVYGQPSPKMQQVFDVVHKAQAAALSAARPGAPCESVDAAARSIIDAAGFGPDYRTFTHRVGHGIGMDGHEWPYLVRGNTLPLQPGMTFSDEPGIYLPGEFGIRLEDDMVITPAGASLLTPQSPSLEHPFG